MYHFFPPHSLIDIFEWRNGFEDASVVDEDVGMAVLLFDLLEERGYGCWVRNVGWHSKGFDIGEVFLDSGGDVV